MKDYNYFQLQRQSDNLVYKFDKAKLPNSEKIRPIKQQIKDQELSLRFNKWLEPIEKEKENIE